ncbi:hypothetical protein Tco_0500640 [Tanacetum coccineum]
MVIIPPGLNRIRLASPQANGFGVNGLLYTVYRAYPRAVRDGVNQSSVKEFFNLLLDNVVDFWVYPSLTLHRCFQAMARLWDLRTLRRAAFSSSFKSLAIMTGNLSSPSKNAYSRWGGSSLSSTSGGSSTEDSTVLWSVLSSQSLSSFLNPGRYVLDLGGMKLDHLLEQENESASSNKKKNHCPWVCGCPERSELGPVCLEVWFQIACDGLLQHEGLISLHKHLSEHDWFSRNIARGLKNKHEINARSKSANALHVAIPVNSMDSESAMGSPSFFVLLVEDDDYGTSSHSKEFLQFASFSLFPIRFLKSKAILGFE